MRRRIEQGTAMLSWRRVTKESKNVWFLKAMCIISSSFHLLDDLLKLEISSSVN